MGINSHYYTVYGISIPYNNELTDKLYETDLYQQFEDKKKKSDCALIVDGMGGDYIVIGKILFDSGDLRYGDIEDTWVEITPFSNVLETHKVLAIDYFQEHFPEHIELIRGTWKLITFVHYS